MKLDRNTAWPGRSFHAGTIPAAASGDRSRSASILTDGVDQVDISRYDCRESLLVASLDKLAQ